MKKILIILFLLAFVKLNAADYYWVGGSGNWSELFHWATTSGGSEYHSAVPDADDNVIFDANSFTESQQVVNIDVGSAYCKNLSFDGADNPVIQGSQRLLVFGSFTLINAMQFDFTGEINLEADSDAFSFTTAGHTLNNKLSFNGSDAQWTFDMYRNEGKMFINGSNNSFTFNSSFFLIDNNSIDNQRASLFVAGDNNLMVFTSDVQIDRNFTISATNSSFTFEAQFSVGSSLQLNGQNSELTISEPLTVGNTFNIGAGIFNTNSMDIAAARFISTTSNTRMLDLGSSDFKVGEWNVSSTNLSFSMLQNTIYVGSEFSSDNLAYFNLIFDVGTAEIYGNNCIVDTIKVSNNTKFNASGFQVHYAELMKNSSFSASNTFDYLVLHANTEHILNQTTNQIINQELTAIGSCTGYIYLHSNIKEKTASITLNSATANIEYAIIRDIEGTGGITASNSVDLGNNTGWTITSPKSRTLYWVGNSGDWSDSQHWSFDSGGTGGACIPSPVDNVVFDENSFDTPNQSVSIDIEDAFCSDMTWTDNVLTPAFTNSETKNNTYIYGSLSLTEAMIYDLNAPLNFEAQTTGHTINTAGHLIKKDVLFSGIGGGWTLASDLDVSLNNIELKNGTLNTNSMTVECMDFTSEKNQDTRSLILGTSEIIIHNQWTLTNDDFSFDAGTSEIVLTKNSAQMNAGDNLVYNNVLFENNTGIAQLYGSNSTFNKMEFVGEGEIRDSDNFFEHLIFRQNGRINKNQTYTTLEFTPPYTYTLVYGTVQTIINQLIASGGCSAYITIQSSSPAGVQAYFEKDGGSLDIGYVILNDIATQGTADFVVHNLAGGENYNGWRIESSNLPRTLYWVGKGATNNWSEQDNWSVQSGGDGGECLPTQIDNVIFDENSFTGASKNVVLDIENVECKTMDWQNAAENLSLEQGVDNKTLGIFGSLYLAENMNIQYYNPVSFYAASEAVIQTNGNTLKSNLNFNNKDGVWTLESELKTSGVLTLQKGTFNTADFDVEIAKFISQTPEKSTFNLASSIVTLTASGICLDIAGDFQLNQQKSEIVFIKNGAGLLITPQYPMDFHNIIFQQSGSVDVAVPYETITFNSIVFNSLQIDVDDKSTIKATDPYNLNLSNVIEADTLLFYTPGTIETDKSVFGRIIFDHDAEIKGTNTIGYAEMFEHGKIYGTNQFDTLILSPPERNYEFESGKTQIINNYFKLAGYSCGKINVYSSVQNNPAFINSRSAQTEIFGYYVRLSDIESSGGATFYAGGDSKANAVRTSGWTFDEPPGFINGLAADTILIAGKTLTIDTENFNGDRFTTYEWDDGVIAPKRDITKAGKYRVTAHYPGCDFPDEINVYFVHINNVDCKGTASASISIEYDRNESYVFDWTGNLNSSQTKLPQINFLDTGIYTVNITHTSNTSTIGQPTAIQIFEITEPQTVLTATIPESTIACFDGQNGELRIFARGGVAPYNYFFIDDTQPQSSLITGLNPNKIYTFAIVDANRCRTEKSSTIHSPPQLSIDYLQTKTPKCFGDKNAEITISVNGGTPDYSFEWNEQPTVSTVFSQLLHNQIYTFEVKDANNCYAAAEISVTTPFVSALRINKTETTPPLCYEQAGGSIDVFAEGGTGDYRFFIDDDISPLPSTIDGLNAGDYHLYVLDANNCEASDEVTISSPDRLSFTHQQTTDLLCSYSSDAEIEITANGGTPPYNYSLDKQNNDTGIFNRLTAGINYQLTVVDANSCSASNNIVLTAPPPLVVVSQTENSCGGAATGKATLDISGGTHPYNIQWNAPLNTQLAEIEKLPAGIYQATIADANSCTTSVEVEIKASETIQFEISNIEHLQCNGDSNGQIEVAAQGGTPPLSYTLNEQNEQGHGLFSGLQGGSYFVAVSDANNCTQQLEVLLDEPEPIVMNVSDVKMSCAGCNNGTFAYTVQGGVRPYIESVLSPLGNKITDLNHLSAGTYQVAVYDDNGCTTGVDVLIREIKLDFTIPNIFTPNSDGRNDIFKIIVDESEVYSFISDFEGVIYSRWGEKIYQWNNAAEGWDGTIHSSNRKAANGTYYYFIQIESIDNKSFTYIGAFTLME